MANKRMFNLDVVDTDLFLEMPISSQALYFHLGMRADEYNIVRNANAIMKMLGCTDKSIITLIARGYVIFLGNGLFKVEEGRPITRK